MSNAPDSARNAPAATSPPPASPRRTRSGGHVVAIVIGCLALLPGLGLLAGGGAIALAQAVATDDEGYFSFTIDRIESDGVAIATTDLWLDDVEGDASPWVLDWIDLDVRLRAAGAADTENVFVGIGRSADVDEYLAGAAFSEIVEIEDHVARYRTVEGSTPVAPPVDQDFWSVSAAGGGEQEVVWEARGGRWSVVVMNADGSPDVAADVEIGARSGAVTPIAVTLLVGGAIVSAFAIVLIVVGARGRRTPGAPTEPRPEPAPAVDGPGPQPTSGAPLPTPTRDTAVQLDHDERHPTGVG